MNQTIHEAFEEQIKKSPKLTEEQISEMGAFQRIGAKVGDRVMFYILKTKDGESNMCTVLERDLDTLCKHSYQSNVGITPLFCEK